MRATLLAVTVAALSGCNLFSVEPDVRLSLEGHFPTARYDLELRVEAAEADQAGVLVDGAERARVRVGTLVVLDISDLGDGSHEVWARIEGSSRRRSSDKVLFTVDRTAPVLIGLEPRAGEISPGPFTATATFSEPIALTTEPVLQAGATPIGTLSAALSADRISLTLSVPSLASNDTFVHFQVVDDAGLPGWIDLGLWRPPDLGFALVEPSPATPLRATVRVAATWSGPSALGVSVDHTPFGTLVPGGDLDLDTTAFTEGPHELRFTAPGYLTVVQAYQFDNRSPQLLSCAPLDARADDAPLGVTIYAVYDEPVGPNGNSVAHSPLTPEPLPFSGVLSLPAVQDAAGNVAPGQPCPLIYPLWRRPFGEGPVTFGSALAPVEVALLSSGWNEVRLARLDGQVGAREVTFPYRSSTQAPATSPRAAQGLVAGQGVAAFVEPTVLGAARISYFPPHIGTEDVVAEFSAGGLDPAVQAVNGNVVAWSDGPAGAKALHLSLSQYLGWYAVDVALPLGSAPGAVAVVGDWPRVVYLVSSAGQGPQLFEQRRSTSGSMVPFFDPPVGPLNLDPGAVASEPAAFSYGADDFLAWVEDGKVLLRRRVSGSGYGPAAVMNADPAQPARSPAFTFEPGGAVLVFLEGGPGGEHFEARRWTPAGGGTWTSLPSFTPGGIVTSASAVWPGLLWTNLAGEVFYRRFNE